MVFTDLLGDSREGVFKKFWLPLAFLAAGIGYTIINFYLYAQEGRPWQLLGTGFMAVGFSICAAVGIWLASRGRQNAGIGLILTAFALGTLILNLLVEDVGLVTGIGLIFMAAAIGSKALTPTATRNVFVLGVAVGLFSIIADLFPALPYRLASPSLITYTPWFILPLALIALFSIIREFSAYSLRAKLVTGFSLLTLLTAGILSFYSAYANRQAILDNVQSEMTGSAENHALLVGEELSRQIESLQLIALDDLIRAELHQLNEDYQGSDAEIYARLLEYDRQWIEQDEGGTVLLEERISNDLAQDLRRFQQVFPDQAEIFITDRYGGLVAATEATSDYYQADEDWWKQAYNNGQGAIYISEPIFDESANILGIQFSIPIFDTADNENITGILRTTYSLEKISEFLAHGSSVDHEGIAHGVSEAHDRETHVTILLPDDREWIVELDPTIDNGIKTTLIEADFIGEIAHSEAEHSTGETESIDGESDFSEHVHEGVLKYVVTNHVQDSLDSETIHNLNWVVSVERDAESILGILESGNRGTILLSIFLTGLSVAGALWLAQIFSNPLLELSEVAGNLGKGDLSARSDYKGSDEIGILSVTFNQMAGQLQETLSNLEGQVDARTRDLLLAVDVGQKLTEVKELDDLLRQAVEVIQEQFNLYHAQIYLVDPTGQELVLRGATGEAGSALMQRGHRLSIGPGSISGTAASTQKAMAVNDTLGSGAHLKNPDLPLTRSEMAVPMLSAGKVLGVLNMQSEVAGDLNDEKLPVFAAIANQLTSSIENASLFTESVEAQRLLESQTKQLMREGWDDFMNGIEESEQVGYAYDLSTIQPLNAITDIDRSETAGLTQPIAVSEVSVGMIQVEGGEERNWSKADNELVESIAGQVARRIENLRLLEQADRYRRDAEQAVRRLTREGWSSYLRQKGEVIGFNYDQRKVAPLSELIDPSEGLTEDLIVRNEIVGRLHIDGAFDADNQTKDFVNNVAEQLSAHIENLRLAEQTEEALSETREQAERLQALNNMSGQFARAESVEDLARIVVSETQSVVSSDQITMSMGNVLDGAFSLYALDTEEGQTPLGVNISLTNSSVGQAVANKEVTVVQNYAGSRYSDADDMAKRGIFSAVIAPLSFGDSVFGALNLGSSSPYAFDEQDANFMQQVASLFAATIQNRQLLTETQRQATKLAALNQMSEKMAQASSLALISKIVTQELETVVEYDHASLMWYDQEKSVYVVDAIEGVRGNIKAGVVVPAKGSVVGDLINYGRLIHIENSATSDKIDAQLMTRLGLKSMAVVPLQRGAVTIGALNIARKAAHAFTPQELTLLQQVASLTSATAENQNLLQQTENALATTELLNELGLRLNAADSFEGMLDALVDSRIAVGSDAATITLIEQDEAGAGTQWMKTIAVWHRDPTSKRFVVERLQKLHSNPIGEQLLAAPTEPIMLENIAANLTFSQENKAYFERLNVAGMATIPLVVRNQLVGGVNFYWETPVQFSVEDKRLYQGLVSLAGTVFQSQNLLEETKQRAENERRLREITERLYSTTNLDVILQTAVEEVGRMLGRKATIQLGTGSELPATPQTNGSAKNGHHKNDAS